MEKRSLSGNRYLLARLNPLYYFVEGELPPVSTWIAVIIIVALVSTVAFWLFVRFPRAHRLLAVRSARCIEPIMPTTTIGAKEGAAG
ncbi:MAG TPA: hypothetical protein VMA33_06115 [Candidatus Tectomicrobia bacterium]|nr:hypothetical protein [Candidatus Tectomicrobia bacterium]